MSYHPTPALLRLLLATTLATLAACAGGEDATPPSDVDLPDRSQRDTGGLDDAPPQDVATDQAPPDLPDSAGDAVDSAPDVADTDADETNLDGGDDGGPDPCIGRTLCAAAQPDAACDDDELVTCVANPDGCRVEVRRDCVAEDLECITAEGAADCAASGGGEQCGDAPVIAAGIHAFDTTGFVNDYGTFGGACGNLVAPGPDAVYRVSVPAGQTLTVTATPALTYDLALAVSGTCFNVAGTCLDASDTGFAGDPETVTATNSSGSPNTFFIVVDGNNFVSAGPFTLSIGLSP